MRRITKNKLNVVLLVAMLTILNAGVAMAAGGSCTQHSFTTRYLGAVSAYTSKHRVTYEGKTVECTITTTTYSAVDVCNNCGYNAGSYLTSVDSHSVPHVR